MPTWRCFPQRSRIKAATIKELLAMPEGSLGREYGAFMDRHGLTPDAIPRVAFVIDQMNDALPINRCLRLDAAVRRPNESDFR